jgi:hypothetical protein
VVTLAATRDNGRIEIPVRPSRLFPYLVLSFSTLTAPATAADSVLLLSSRNGSVEAIDPSTLETVMRLRTPRNTASAASDAAGSKLLMNAPADGKNCCTLYALDPSSLKLTAVVSPSLSVTVAGPRLLTQRGNSAIEIFDSHTLEPLPKISASGIYHLYPSPDGARVFGIATGPEPMVDLFDAPTGERIVSHALQSDAHLAGAWMGAEFYLFLIESGRARLLRIRNDTGQFSESVQLHPGDFPVCAETPYDIAATGGRIAIYARFGAKSTGSCALPGGFVVADMSSGPHAERFAPTLHFFQMIAAFNDGYFYGLDSGSSWEKPRLVKLDPATGKVVAEKALAAGVWSLTAGSLPDALKGHVDLVAH